MGRNMKYGVAIHPLVRGIEALRVRSGLTVGELCKKAFISITTYYKWTEGRTSPKLEHLAAVADVFGREIGMRKKVEQNASQN